jgi:hypothetical protein
LEKAAQKIDDDDQAKLEQLDARYEALDEEQRKLEASAPVAFKEATKARGTVFLILGPDGQVHREYRVLRQKAQASAAGSQTRANSNGSGDPSGGTDDVPTSEQLSDRQLAITFTHQALCVREALLTNALARKRVLALALHEKVRSEALAVRHEANGTTLHATTGDDFKSCARDRLMASRAKLDPFTKQHVIDDVKAYDTVAQLPEKQLDKLIELLTIELVSAHLARPTDLIVHLADELKVNVRADWRPDAHWLSSFQKSQLAHLITDLKGAVHAPDPARKKSELVDSLDKLFTHAAEGKLEDKRLADKLNTWLPVNLRPAATSSD